MWFRLLTGLVTLVLCAGAAEKPLTPEQKRLNAESFEYVWTTVRDKHWDPKLNGIDWQAVHDELRPKLDKAKTMDQARGIMMDMLSRLKETHFGIEPADVYEDLGGADDSDGKSKPSHEGSPGISVRVLDGRAIVTAVDADSPADRAGVKPGWEIVRIGGTELSKRIKRIHEKFADSTLHDLLEERSVSTLLTGDVGSNVKVSFVDGTNRALDVGLSRARTRGVLAQFGNLPPLYFWVESKKLDPDIGMVRFNIFFQPDTLVKAVQDTVHACKDCKGMIVDVRGNPGGIGGLAMGLSGWFVDKPGQQLGTMYMRGTKLNFAVFARPDSFHGPLAILVDGCSASTSELFAEGLKDLGRARIFGSRSAGAALPSVFERLPNGDGFQYAIANYISFGGKPLEGNGVIPDVEVKLTRQALLAGRDPVLDAAVNWIENQKN